jgi:RNA polymerase sigma factor (sigma-70 family)
MNVQISYRIRRTPDIEKEVTHFLNKLRRRLQVFRPELVHLKGLVEQSSAREGFIVSLNLRLPSGQMAAQRSAPLAAAALKAGFDDLLQQLTKHKDLLRNSHKWSRRRSGNSRTERQVPFEETIAFVQPSRISSEDIRSYINANLSRLELYVERELYFREIGGQIAPGSITKEEIVDEAVMRALGDGGEKPERLALEPWLYRLAIRSLDDLAARSGDDSRDVHLEESARQRNVRASDEPELQFHQPDETLTEESVIADRRTATPEDIASSDEMLRLVQFALGAVNRADREAFILVALEGFSIEEVADITGRPPDRILNSITVARQHLRQTAPVFSRFRDQLIEKNGTA